MADPSNGGSLDPQKLDDLRASLSKATSPSVHRSQTVPNQVGRTKVDAGQPFSNLLVSRSYTMPLSTDLQVDSEARPGMPLNPLRRSPSATSTDALNTRNNVHNNGRRLLVIWFVCCVSVLIIAPLLSVILGVTLHNKDFSFTSNSTGLLGRTLTLSMSLVSVDPVQSVATFDWTIFGDNNPCDANTPDGECTDVNIFFDRNILTGEVNSQPSNDIPSVPVFRFNAFSSGDPRASSRLFRTDILIFSRGQDDQSSLIRYPFDVYAMFITMFAQDSNNESVNLEIAESSGNAVGFNTFAEDCPTDSSIPELLPGMICIAVGVERGVLVRVFCIIVIIAIWMITMTLLLLTLTSIIFGFRQRAEVLIVPVVTIFAFTQLRSSMPGAPEGFGDILDFVGILPCLGILAFSAALSLGAFILTDPEQKAEVLTWGRLRRELWHARKGPSMGNSEYVDEV